MSNETPFAGSQALAIGETVPATAALLEKAPVPFIAVTARRHRRAGRSGSYYPRPAGATWPNSINREAVLKSIEEQGKLTDELKGKSRRLNAGALETSICLPSERRTARPSPEKGLDARPVHSNRQMTRRGSGGFRHEGEGSGIGRGGAGRRRDIIASG